jgi:hypothetical protein
MKALKLLLIIAITITACGPESSPEGRMTLKLTDIKLELDSLKTQNIAIKNSLKQIRAELQAIKK